MSKTGIEWVQGQNGERGETWNPMRGCRRISPGCGGPNNEGGCYAERQAIRFAGPGGPYEGLVKSTPNGPRWTGAVVVDEEKLLEPLSWKKPRTVFVDSMSDLFFEAFTDEQVARAVATMALTPHITYQVLTKRAERMADLLNSETFWTLVATDDAGLKMDPATFKRPLPNVWWGVSCEDREHGLPRLEHLRRTPAAVRMVSFEPLLEHLGEVDLTGFQWAIMGGESGPRSRPCDIGWIRSLVALSRRYGVAPFVKQLGAAAVWDSEGPGGAHALDLKHKKGADMTEWPMDLRVREMPVVAAP